MTTMTTTAVVAGAGVNADRSGNGETTASSANPWAAMTTQTAPAAPTETPAVAAAAPTVSPPVTPSSRASHEPPPTAAAAPATSPPAQAPAPVPLAAAQPRAPAAVARPRTTANTTDSPAVASLKRKLDFLAIFLTLAIFAILLRKFLMSHKNGGEL